MDADSKWAVGSRESWKVGRFPSLKESNARGVERLNECNTAKSYLKMEQQKNAFINSRRDEIY